ncbi:enoyl-CoA hydratase/isomerase family protein [Pseudarthrobacter sp. B4EP4b]|uniref:enoyl-CoA hydratase/isomerase family protein n=1 Tax=Pseudarthrobacter sp. B4EP4b TaxID=2590664 RepID=UPI00114E666C|nr:enoyl-CoA hydratase-related protein [Pseudarthrobacter sp. B4EP4b]
MSSNTQAVATTGADDKAFEFLRLEVDEALVTVWFTRPPVNSVSQAMYREIERFFSHPERFVPGIKAVVLAGEGRHFCAGNDLHEFGTLTPENSDERMAEVRAAFFAIQNCSVPVIAAVQGAAVGTGLAIAASCDFVIAATTARFGTPEVSVGIMGGARHLARLVPEPLVRWMYFTGDPIDVRRLEQVGGVIEVVPADELLTRAHEYAAAITRHSGEVIRTAKRSLNTIETMDLQEGYIFEQSLTREISGHPDSREARQATLEQRPPHYPSERK